MGKDQLYSMRQSQRTGKREEDTSSDTGDLEVATRLDYFPSTVLEASS